MIRAIVFDCFGVIVRGSLDYWVSRVPHEKQQAVRDVNHGNDYGYISHQQYLDQMSELIGVSQGEIEKTNLQTHVRDKDMERFIIEQRRNYKTAMLSNVGFATIDKIFDQTELDQMFDTVVLSSDIHMAKPSASAYEYVVGRLGVDLEEAVLIDDSPNNIDGAQAVGMHGIVYGAFRDCVDDLRKLGVQVDYSEDRE